MSPEILSGCPPTKIVQCLEGGYVMTPVSKNIVCAQVSLRPPLKSVILSRNIVPTKHLIPYFLETSRLIRHAA